MTDLGVFARVFDPGAASVVASNIRNAGYSTTQLNLSVLGRPTLDADLSPDDARAIRSAFEGNGVTIWGVSGTFNAIAPDEVRRHEDARRCAALIDVAAYLGATAVTLCTGTRDPKNMWQAHPANGEPAAWDDLLETLSLLIPHAAQAGIKLGVEPEHGNVIRDARAATRLLAELGEDAAHLGIVLDPANLLTVDSLGEQQAILEQAFTQLGDHVVAVHAKDVVSHGYAAPGCGGMDYELVFKLHARLPHDVPIIAQDLRADDARRVHEFLLEQQRQAST